MAYLNTSDIEALKTAYSRLNYEQFCIVIDNIQDDYAEAKFVAFRDMLTNIDKLGTFLPKLIAWGKANA